MKIEIPDEYTCLKCTKRKVCKFRTPLQKAVSSILSEVGNWKDRKQTMNVIYAIVGVNCHQFEAELEEEE